MQLMKYDTARRALAEAHRVDEVKDIRDRAVAVSAYARQAKDTELMQMACEIKVRAEKRLGEMIREQKETVGLADGGEHGGDRTNPGSHAEPGSRKPTLADAGIDKKLSMRAQQLAAMPAEHFEAAIAVARETASVVSTSYMLRIAEQSQRNAAHEREIEELENRSYWMNARDALESLCHRYRMSDEDTIPECPAKIEKEICERITFLSGVLRSKRGTSDEG